MKASVIQLQPGQACEIEIFITAVFATNIQTEISLVSSCIEQGKEYTDSIVVDATSELSIKIDPTSIEIGKNFEKDHLELVSKEIFEETLLQSRN